MRVEEDKEIELMVELRDWNPFLTTQGKMPLQHNILNNDFVFKWTLPIKIQ